MEKACEEAIHRDSARLKPHSVPVPQDDLFPVVTLLNCLVGP